ARERPRHLRDEDLAAGRGVGDSRGDEDRAAEVAALLGDHVAAVHARAYAQRHAAPLEGELDLDRAADGAAGAREREHELVALALHLDAAGSLQRTSRSCSRKSSRACSSPSRSTRGVEFSMSVKRTVTV